MNRLSRLFEVSLDSLNISRRSCAITRITVVFNKKIIGKNTKMNTDWWSILNSAYGAVPLA